MIRAFGVLLTFLALTFLATAAPAMGATYYATPQGTTTGSCPENVQCTLERAVSLATEPGDNVVVGPGQYGTQVEPVQPFGVLAGVTVHGVPGSARPRIFVTTTNPDAGSAIQLGVDAVIRDLDVNVTRGLNGIIFSDGSVLERARVIVLGPAYGLACNVRGQNARILNSVCAGKDTPGLHVAPGAFSVIVRQSTATGSEGLQAREGTIVDAVNSAFIGTAHDIRTSEGSTVTTNSSAWSTTFGTGSITGHGTVAGEPVFLDAANGDYRQDLGSPTINAGAAHEQSGTTDLDGQPRRIGPASDIGADEATLAPVVSTGAVTEISTTSATIAMTVDSGWLLTQPRAEWGPTDAVANQTAGADLAASVDPGSASVTISGLAPSTTYFVRAAASNAAGTGRGATVSFRTADPPAVAPPPPAVTAPSVTIGAPAKAKLDRRRRIIVPVTNPGTAELRGSAALKIGKRTIARVKELRLPAGRTTRVAVKLSAAERRKLGNRTRRAVFIVTVRDAAGKATTFRKVIRIRR